MPFKCDPQKGGINTDGSKNGPSGYGVFGFLHNGKLIENHYISTTLFKNILKKELKI